MGIYHDDAGSKPGRKAKKDKSTRNAALTFCITTGIFAGLFGLNNAASFILCGLVSLLAAAVIKIATMPMKGLDNTSNPSPTLEDVDDEIARTTVATGLELKQQLEQVRNAINEHGFTRRINDFITVYREMLNMVLKDYDKATRLRKMNAYYLPTIIKLLNGYLEAKKNGASYTEISGSREKLFGTLDQLVQAARDEKDAMIRSDLEEFDIKREVLDDTLKADGYTDDDHIENLREAAAVAARELPLTQQMGSKPAAQSHPVPGVTLQNTRQPKTVQPAPQLQGAPTAAARQMSQGAPVLEMPVPEEKQEATSRSENLTMF